MLYTVIGFEMMEYNLEEQVDSYQLTIKVLTPPTSLTSDVTLHVTAMPGNATGKKSNNTEITVACMDDTSILIICLPDSFKRC